MKNTPIHPDIQVDSLILPIGQMNGAVAFRASPEEQLQADAAIAYLNAMLHDALKYGVCE